MAIMRKTVIIDATEVFSLSLTSTSEEPVATFLVTPAKA